MKRCDYLRAHLKGETPPTISGPRAYWALNHSPLLSPQLFAQTGRHLNNFCIGSDPEFCFQRSGTKKLEAYSVGMKVGLAVGCDQNERLVEMRPYPSPSVIEHVAGILTDFRWMYRVYGQELTGVSCRAGAFFDGDGMGGHVHFGRKRPTRTEEVAALDGLTRGFVSAGLFPMGEWTTRSAGDTRGQQYGLPGDIRIQKHGYEYRSLPSWLQSPTIAFIVLASSKLSVLDPSITVTWPQRSSALDARNRLRGLAKLYKGLDDDAYILYHLLTKQGDAVFDIDYTADCAPKWGIDYRDLGLGLDSKVILPACIKPTEDEVAEIQNHFLFDAPLTFQKTKPEFRTSLPERYRWEPNYVTPRRRAGFGDLIHDLVTIPDHPITWEYDQMSPLLIHGVLPMFWSAAEIALLRRYCPNVTIVPREQPTTIRVPKDLCKAVTISGLKAILTKSGLFPIWSVDSVKTTSYKEWKETHSKKRKAVVKL